jgi:hypothetical protein
VVALARVGCQKKESETGVHIIPKTPEKPPERLPDKARSITWKDTTDHWVAELSRIRRSTTAGGYKGALNVTLGGAGRDRLAGKLLAYSVQAVALARVVTVAERTNPGAG